MTCKCLRYCLCLTNAFEINVFQSNKENLFSTRIIPVSKCIFNIESSDNSLDAINFLNYVKILF